MGEINLNLFPLILKKFIFNLHTVKFILVVYGYITLDKCIQSFNHDHSLKKNNRFITPEKFPHPSLS